MTDFTDMRAFGRTFCHLAADPYAEAALAEDVGRRVRYAMPAGRDRAEWVRSVGTLAATELYEVVGVQRIYDGTVAYRVRCLAYDDTFGRPMRPSEAKFEDDRP